GIGRGGQAVVEAALLLGDCVGQGGGDVLRGGDVADLTRGDGLRRGDGRVAGGGGRGARSTGSRDRQFGPRRERVVDVQAVRVRELVDRHAEAVRDARQRVAWLDDVSAAAAADSGARRRGILARHVDRLALDQQRI